MRLAIVIFAVESLEHSLAFYQRAFGWSKSVDTPVYVELEVGASLTLGLYDRNGFGRNVGQAPSPAIAGEVSRTELYFQVESLADAIRSLEQAGARCLSPRQVRAWGDEAAYFADPDGNVLVVATRIG